MFSSYRNQLICRTFPLTGFHMMGTRSLKGKETSISLHFRSNYLIWFAWTLKSFIEHQLTYFWTNFLYILSSWVSTDRKFCFSWFPPWRRRYFIAPYSSPKIVATAFPPTATFSTRLFTFFKKVIFKLSTGDISKVIVAKSIAAKKRKLRKFIFYTLIKYLKEKRKKSKRKKACAKAFFRERKQIKLHTTRRCRICLFQT